CVLVTHMFVPSNAIAPGSRPTAKVPSVAPLGGSGGALWPAPVWMPALGARVARPSWAGAGGTGPTATVPSMPALGDSGGTGVARPVPPALATHMFVPSNAIAPGARPRAKVPSGPHVEGMGRVFLHAPGARDVTGASGARQSWRAGGQTHPLDTLQIMPDVAQ